MLSGVRFEICPACGTPVDTTVAEQPDQCYLCARIPSTTKPEAIANTETAKRDIEARIEDLRNYDSLFVAQTREADGQVATLTERLKNLKKLKKLPEAIEQLLKEADELRIEEESIRRGMEREKEGLTSAHQIIEELERTYLEALVAVGVPGVTSDDSVQINRKSWIPSICERGDEALAWNFFNTGSGGKKTLLNVCYAIAIHEVAADRSLPLPTLLMIDTPMKNIGEEVNRDVFVSFYQHLYHLIEGPLANTQVIIIDKEYIAPTNEKIEIIERFMTPDQDGFPPLITYYRGA